MDTAFQICAGLGGALLLCQFLASLVGLGADHDADTGGGDADTHDGDDGHDSHDGNWFLGLLTFRAVSAAVTFFGLGGLCGRYYGADDPAAFGLALLGGVGALYAVATLMRSLARLKADGTVRIERAVGLSGTVYLRVPAGREAAGKVHVCVQNRTVEYQAVTADGELPTGRAVRVVAIIGPGLVEVVAA